VDTIELKLAAERGKGMASSSRLNDTYDADESEFLMAMDSYKRHYHRPNPTCCEILAVLKSLGWRKKTATESKVVDSVAASVVAG